MEITNIIVPPLPHQPTPVVNPLFIRSLNPNGEYVALEMFSRIYTKNFGNSSSVLQSNPVENAETIIYNILNNSASVNKISEIDEVKELKKSTVSFIESYLNSTSDRDFILNTSAIPYGLSSYSKIYDTFISLHVSVSRQIFRTRSFNFITNPFSIAVVDDLTTCRYTSQVYGDAIPLVLLAIRKDAIKLARINHLLGRPIKSEYIKCFVSGIINDKKYAPIKRNFLNSKIKPFCEKEGIEVIVDSDKLYDLFVRVTKPSDVCTIKDRKQWAGALLEEAVSGVGTERILARAGITLK